MLNMPMSAIQGLTRGEWLGGEAKVTSVVTDNRQVIPGSLFVAIKGKSVDGHDYVQKAYESGAVGALVERRIDSPLPQIVVKNSLVAVADIAREHRKHFHGWLISITGSSGKTSTKEMLVSILSMAGKVISTRGNQNNELGVPLTLLNLENSADFAVVEMGAAQQGDIAYLMDIAQPDVTAITNVGCAHIGRFGSEEIIAETKSEIYKELKASGKAVVNLDDKYSMQWISCLVGHPVTTFSLNKITANVFVADINLSAEESSFVLHYANQQSIVTLSVPGLHNIANALCAAACAFSVGCSFENVVSGLQNFVAVASRLQKLTGFWKGVLIDDCYNANPGSVRAAIDVLSAYSANRVLVLGDMAELGEASISAHEEVGKYAFERGINTLLTCGVDSVAAGKVFGGQSVHFGNKHDLIIYMKTHLSTGDVVLVKGSRSAALEEVVKAVLLKADN